MFGINSWEQVGQIAKGHYKEFTGNITDEENRMYNQRMRICRECPLYTNKPGIGPVCDAKKWYDPETGESGVGYKPEAKTGCGCRLHAALYVKNKECVLDKW